MKDAGPARYEQSGMMITCANTGRIVGVQRTEQSVGIIVEDFDTPHLYILTKSRKSPASIANIHLTNNCILINTKLFVGNPVLRTHAVTTVL